MFQSDKKPSGRPRKDIFTKRAAPITVRLTETELLTVERAALVAGLTVSAFVRSAILRPTRRDTINPLILYDLLQVSRAVEEAGHHDLADQVYDIVAQLQP